jgi:hypothetical protein
MQVWRSGRVVDYSFKGCWFAASLCSLVFRGHRASNVKLRILECFTLYLRNRQSGNLRAIENCICGLRSIERNMRSFLRTVWMLPVNQGNYVFAPCETHRYPIWKNIIQQDFYKILKGTCSAKWIRPKFCSFKRSSFKSEVRDLDVQYV